MHPDLDAFDAEIAARRQKNAATRESRRKRKRVAAGAVMLLAILTFCFAAVLLLSGPRWEYSLLVSIGAFSLMLGIRSWRVHSPERAL
jgi:hypothetical protein